MKCFDSKRQVVIIISITVAGLLHLVEAADEFRRCYNTSENMHCFDVQIDPTNNEWLITSFDKARRRCYDLNSTLPIIKDEETQSLIEQFLEDSDNPVRLQYIWTDAYRANDHINAYTWHWIDSTLPTIPASDVAYRLTAGYGQRYVAALEFINTRFYLMAQQAQLNNSYVCEYAGENVRYTNWIEDYHDWTLPCLSIWIGFTPSFSWSPMNCHSEDVYVVCHTVTALVTTKSTMKSTMKYGTEVGRSSCDCISVGVGLGIPLAILIVLVIVLTAKYKRLSTLRFTTRAMNMTRLGKPLLGK